MWQFIGIISSQTDYDWLKRCKEYLLRNTCIPCCHISTETYITVQFMQACGMFSKYFNKCKTFPTLSNAKEDVPLKYKSRWRHLTNIQSGGAHLVGVQWIGNLQTKSIRKSIWHHVNCESSFLCRHSAMLAYVYASAWTTSPPKLQGLETCCFFYLIYRGWKIARHANLSVRLLEPLQGRYPHQKCENFNTLSQFSQWLLQRFLSYLAYK